MTEYKPNVRVFFADFKEAWYKLPEEELIEFMRKDREKLDGL